VKDPSGLIVDVKTKYRLQQLHTFWGKVVTAINVVVHSNPAFRCRAPRRKVELDLPEVYLGVVPPAGNIDLSFSCWEHVLVINVKVFRAECRRF